MNKSLTLELPSLDELYQQWREDRRQRRYMPVRRCIGLAAIFRDVDECECVNDMVLYPNDAITWVCMRDVPARYSTTGSPQTLVTTAKAKLQYGMPHIDFAENVRDSIDFSKIPTRRPYTNALHPDVQHGLFALLNRMSEQMTRAVPKNHGWPFLPRPRFLVADVQQRDLEHSSFLSIPTLLRVGTAGHTLWWDLSPAERFVDTTLSAAFMPPTLSYGNCRNVRILPETVVSMAVSRDFRFNSKSLPIAFRRVA